MSERDELAAQRGELQDLVGDAAERDDDDWFMDAANAILAAGYRKVEPAWEPSLRNDGTYEYTQTSTCDGSTVYNYRRLPRLEYVGSFPSWETYEPEEAK